MMSEKMGGGERVQDPNLAEEMAYAEKPEREKPYKEKRRLFGLVGPSEADKVEGLYRAQTKSERIQQAAEFKKRAEELEGKVKDFQISASGMLCNDEKSDGQLDFIGELYSAQFNIGDDRIEIKFWGNYGYNRSDKKDISIGVNEHSFVVAINGSQLNVYEKGQGLARKFIPLLKTKAEEFVRGRSDKDMQQAKIDARLRKQEEEKRLRLEVQKVEEIIKVIK